MTNFALGFDIQLCSRGGGAEETPGGRLGDLRIRGNVGKDGGWWAAEDSVGKKRGAMMPYENVGWRLWQSRGTSDITGQ